MMSIPNTHRSFISTLLLSVLAFFAANAQTGKCIILSDIHIAPSVTQTEIGKDGTFSLLSSALVSVPADAERLDFVLITGDMVGHGLKDGKAKSAIIDSIAAVLRAKFPGVPLVPALGNNDSDAGNYTAQSREFLTAFDKSWQLNNLEGDHQYLDSLGYYTYIPKFNPDLEIIVLNSTLLCESGHRDNGQKYAQGAAMLNWMDEQLKSTKGKAWIVFHIPPGIDVFSDLRSHKNKYFWEKDYYDHFLKSVVAYSSKVKVTIAGHTHRNDFRVIYNNNSPKNFIRIVPSLSPVYGNNPSYEVAEFSKSDFELKKETTYFKDITPNSADTTWHVGFGINTLGIKKANTKSLAHFIKDLSNLKDTSDAKLKAYIDFFNVGATGYLLKAVPLNLNEGNYKTYLEGLKLEVE